MRPPNESRRPDERNGALKIAGRRISPEDTTGSVVESAPTCPLACSPSCTFRCPVALAVVLDELTVQR